MLLVFLLVLGVLVLTGHGADTRYDRPSGPSGPAWL